VARQSPPSTVSLSGNGLDTSAVDEEGDGDGDGEALTGGPGNGANPNWPQGV
jgi:hypothetical protein